MMANPERGEVSLALGEKEYMLKVTSNKIVTAEQYNAGHGVIGGQFNMGTIRALFFVCCKGQNGLQTIEQAGDLMDNHFAAISNAVAESVGFFSQNQVGLP